MTASLSISLTGPAGPITLELPEQKLALLTGAGPGKSWLAKMILLEESNRIELAQSEIKAGNLKLASNWIENLNSKKLPRIRYIDWAKCYQRPLSLLAALNLQDCFTQYLAQNAEFHCCDCGEWSTAIKNGLAESILNTFREKLTVIAAPAPKAPENLANWIASILSSGFEKFIYQGELLNLSQTSANLPQIHSATNFFVITDIIKITPQQDQARLENAILTATKLGTGKICCFELQDQTELVSKYYFGSDPICRSCGLTLFQGQGNINSKPLFKAEFCLHGQHSDQWQTQPIATFKNLLSDAPGKFLQNLTFHLTNLEMLSLAEIPLLGEHKQHQIALNLANSLHAIEAFEYILIDHASLGLSDSWFERTVNLYKTVAQRCAGVLVLDQQVAWRQHVSIIIESSNYLFKNIQPSQLTKLAQNPGQAQPSLSLAKLLEVTQKSISTETAIEVGSAVTSELKFVCLEQHLFEGLIVSLEQEQLHCPKKPHINCLTRSSLEPGPTISIFDYLGLSKLFAEYLSKTQLARVAGLSAKNILELPLAEQSDFIFKQHTLQSIGSTSIANLQESFSALPDLARILSRLIQLDFGEVTSGTKCALLARSQIDKLKLVKKLSALPKSCQLLVIEEPIIALAPEQLDNFYLSFSSLLSCPTWIVVSSPALIPTAYAENSCKLL